MDPQILMSARLRMEPLSIAHADQLFQLYQDPELYLWIFKDPPTDLTDFRNGVRFLENRLSRDQSEYWLNWVLFKLDGEEMTGKVEISLHRSTRRALLGYTVFRQHWKSGYAREACAAVIEHVFRDWNASKVAIEIDTRNDASIRLAERLGANRIGSKPKAEFFKGAWSDEYHYEILREDWETQNGSVRFSVSKQLRHGDVRRDMKDECWNGHHQVRDQPG